jgi:hypothetical protein
MIMIIDWEYMDFMTLSMKFSFGFQMIVEKVKDRLALSVDGVDG